MDTTGCPQMLAVPISVQSSPDFSLRAHHLDDLALTIWVARRNSHQPRGAPLQPLVDLPAQFYSTNRRILIKDKCKGVNIEC